VKEFTGNRLGKYQLILKG